MSATRLWISPACFTAADLEWPEAHRMCAGSGVHDVDGEQMRLAPDCACDCHPENQPAAPEETAR